MYVLMIPGPARSGLPLKTPTLSSQFPPAKALPHPSTHLRASTFSIQMKTATRANAVSLARYQMIRLC